MAEIFSIGEKWLKSVTSSRTLTWSSSSGRAEVPARAMAAAVIARRIAALPPHECGNLTERSSSFYTSKPHEEQQAEELQKEFYEEEFDPVRFMLQDIPEHEVKQSFFDHKVGQRLLQLEDITEKLSKQVMEHHEEMALLDIGFGSLSQQALLRGECRHLFSSSCTGPRMPKCQHL